MKKRISLALCFALLLSLLPGTVLAETTEAKQLYAISGRSGDQYFDSFSTPAGGSSSFQLATAINGDPITREYYTISCDTAVGTIDWKGNDNSTVLWDTQNVDVEEGASGNIFAYYQNGNDTEVYKLPVKVNGWPFRLYDAETGGNRIPAENRGYTVSYTTRESKTYYFRTEGDATFAAEGCNAEMTVTGDDGNTVKIIMGSRLSDTVYAVTIQSGWSGQARTRVTLKMNGGMEYGFKITFDDGSGNQGGNNSSQDNETIISEEHARTDADTYHGNFVDGSSHMSASFQVTAGEEVYTVYMIPQGPNFEIAHQYDGREMALTSEQQQVSLDLGVGFFLKEGDSLRRITNSTLLDAIKEEIGNSLSLQVFTASGNDYPLSSMIPAIYKIPDTATSLNNIRLKLGLAHRGLYIFRAVCTVDGVPLSSEMRVEWRPTFEHVFEPVLNAQKDPIVQINEFLAGLSYNENVSVMINLPEGDFTGYIVVPANLGRMRIFVNGTKTNDVIRTTLNGGLETLNFSVTTRNINFVGAGASQKNWANEHANGGRPNYALYGGGAISGNGANFGGGSHSENCTFTGYDIAIYSTYRLRTAANNLFTGNNVALCYDTQNDDGGSDMTRNEFNGNEIGIYFKSLRKPGWFVLTGTKFIDNEIDIKNDLKKNIFVPGCYFADTVQGVLTVRECRSDSPNPGGVAKKQVLVYPQAATQTYGQDNKFTDFIYDTAFYASNGKKGPMISKNFAAIFPVPEGALAGNTFRIMDPDTNKVIKFTFPAATGN